MTPVQNLDELLQTQPRFVVLCVPRAVVAALMIELSQRGVSVLAETPPAADLDDLNRLWRDLPTEAKIQVAEQYPFQPYHMTAKALIDSGRLGRIDHVQAAVAHDYHGVAQRPVASPPAPVATVHPPKNQSNPRINSAAGWTSAKKARRSTTSPVINT